MISTRSSSLLISKSSEFIKISLSVTLMFPPPHAHHSPQMKNPSSLTRVKMLERQLVLLEFCLPTSLLFMAWRRLFLPQASLPFYSSQRKKLISGSHCFAKKMVTAVSFAHRVPPSHLGLTIVAIFFSSQSSGLCEWIALATHQQVVEPDI